jgi:hypothetical protein
MTVRWEKGGGLCEVAHMPQPCDTCSRAHQLPDLTSSVPNLTSSAATRISLVSCWKQEEPCSLPPGAYLGPNHKAAVALQSDSSMNAAKCQLCNTGFILTMLASCDTVVTRRDTGHQLRRLIRACQAPFNSSSTQSPCIRCEHNIASVIVFVYIVWQACNCLHRALCCSQVPKCPAVFCIHLHRKSVSRVTKMM